MFFYFISFLFCILVKIHGDTETTLHGTPNSHLKEHSHHEHIDSLIAEEFSDLSETESKNRLKILASENMDTNKDGIVTPSELIEFIHNSLLALDKEETDERFDEIDIDKNGEITWDEYLRDSFGIKAEKEIEKMLTDPEEAKLLNEDRKYFQAADLNMDKKLNKREFEAFQNPEHFEEMHSALIENTLFEKDEDKDGKISLKEFMGETFDLPNSEWFTTEKERFHNEYDLNKDGYLKGQELNLWLIPDIKQTAIQEAEHLLQIADENKDAELSFDEITKAYKAFVGSEATDYGKALLEIKHEEL